MCSECDDKIKYMYNYQTIIIIFRSSLSRNVQQGITNFMDIQAKENEVKLKPIYSTVDSR